MKLFVYGTLKKGYNNHHYLDTAKYLGQYYCDNTYALVQSGLPFLVKRKGMGAIGELYEVDLETIKAIDKLEGHPFFYRRTNIFVKSMVDDKEIEVYTYIHPDIFDKNFGYGYKIVKEYTGT